MRRRREVGYCFKRRRMSDIKDSGAAGPSPAVPGPFKPGKFLQCPLHWHGAFNLATAPTDCSHGRPY
jgi:hypothetical protein